MLARIDSPAAIEGLIELLRSHPVAESQIGFALLHAAVPYQRVSYELNGDWGYGGLEERVTAALTQLLESRAVRDRAVQLVAIEILGYIGTISRVPPAPLYRFSAEQLRPVETLARLASDLERPMELRKAAILAIPSIWGSELVTLDVLRELARSDPSELGIDASAALFIVEGPQGNASFPRALAPLMRPGSGLLDATRTHLEHYRDSLLNFAMARYARSGREMHDLTSPLIQLLSTNGAPNARLTAAWALGLLDDSSAGPSLLRALDDEDWLLAAVAAESIGRLGYRPARERLAALSETHWYPPVRGAMRRAGRALAGEHAYPAIPDSTGPAFFYEISDPGKLPGPVPAPCERRDPLPEAPREDGWLATGDERRRHAYVIDDPYELGNSRSRLDVVPGFGVRVEGGWLLASDRGEFGGELVFEPDGEPIRFVTRGHFEDVHTLSDGRRVATEGLAHMGSNYGALYEIRQQGMDFSIRFWRRLPGAPETSWVRVDGTLLVNTTRGSVVVHADGWMELAVCSKSAGTHRD